MLVQLKELVKNPEGNNYIWVDYAHPFNVDSAQEALRIVYSLEDEFELQGRSFNYTELDTSVDEVIRHIPDDLPALIYDRIYGKVSAQIDKESCGVMESEWVESQFAPMPDYDPKHDIF